MEIRILGKAIKVGNSWGYDLQVIYGDNVIMTAASVNTYETQDLAKMGLREEAQKVVRIIRETGAKFLSRPEDFKVMSNKTNLIIEVDDI